MDETERYLFDLRGYHAVPGALAPSLVADLNRQIDELSVWEQVAGFDLEYRDPPWWQITDHPQLKWVFPRDRDHLQIGPVLSWGQSWSDATTAPALVNACMNILGPEYYLDHASLVVARDGGRGFDLHGGQVPYLRHQYYAFRDGTFDVGMVAVVIPLTEQTLESGGLAVVPGSHKAGLRFPGRVSDAEAVSLPWVEKLAITPGTAIVFPEATTHAVLPWIANWDRRAILLKLYPAHLRAFAAPLRDPSVPFWAEACKDDMPWHPMRVGSNANAQRD